MIECVHVWDEGEVINPGIPANISESHPCLYCENCGTLIDLTVEDDPREV